YVQSASNSGSEQSYSFRYKVSLSGIQYFRIVQVDIDGKESYSIVRSVNFTAANSEVAIYPNPAKNNLNIFCNTQPGSDVTKAQFYDLSGKLTFIIQLTKGVNNVNIAGLAAGVYIIK